VNEIIVVFRKDTTGDCFALFPELPSDNQGFHCTAYAHLGQHCAADYELCMSRSAPAAPDEYRELYDELERRGYDLTVRHRATPEMHERRRRLAAERRGAALEKLLASRARGRSCLLQQRIRHSR
jgi:hypothetical protein